MKYNEYRVLVYTNDGPGLIMNVYQVTRKERSNDLMLTAPNKDETFENVRIQEILMWLEETCEDFSVQLFPA